MTVVSFPLARKQADPISAGARRRGQMMTFAQYIQEHSPYPEDIERVAEYVGRPHYDRFLSKKISRDAAYSVDVILVYLAGRIGRHVRYIDVLKAQVADLEAKLKEANEVRS